MTPDDLDQLRLAIHEITVGWEYQDPATYKTTDHPGLFYLLSVQLRPVRMDDARRGGKVSGSPAPWAGDIANWLTDIAAGARDHEHSLHAALDNTTPIRGGSDRNTIRALHALPDLVVSVAVRLPASALPRHVSRDVQRWHHRARQILGTERRWARVPFPCPMDDCGAEQSLRQRPADGAVICVMCRSEWEESRLGWLGQVAGDA